MKRTIPNITTSIALALALVFICCNGEQKQTGGTTTGYKYPKTDVKNVVDTVSGHAITDPYRWLEDGQSEKVFEWTTEQNNFTREILDGIPVRGQLQVALDEAMTVGDVSAPQVFGDRYFYTKRDETDDQPILYMKIGKQGDPVSLVDPNSMSEEAIVSLDWYFPSRDGSLVAYGLSTAGDEQSTLRIVNTDLHTILPDTIPRTSAASLAWLPDNSGFYYTRYPSKGEVPAGEEVYHRRIFLHKLGDNPANDKKIFGDNLDMQDWPDPLLSESGRYLAIYVFKGWSKSELYLDDLRDKQAFVPLIKDVAGQFRAAFLGDDLYVRTDFQAPNFRILKADLKGSDVTKWKEVVPERKDAALQSFDIGADRLILKYLHNASSELQLYNPKRKSNVYVDLPGIGSVGDAYGELHGNEIYFEFESFFIPTTIYACDAQSGKIEQYDGIEAAVDPTLFTSRLVKYRSKDSTEVSMFVVHRKDVVLNGLNPVILTGYGGFSHSEKPYFSPTLLVWLRNGGVYALPHLRGGAEYGEAWHKAGMLDKKQNTFDDFIAAAEYLIDQKYTSSERLAIWGGSNGGLLVGAAETQRPDLFRVVICSNPLLDMVRYHKFLIARLWVPEYGSADNPDQFDFIYAYSPYHHVVDGTAYPATLILTSDSDSRVDPLHARKMVARLQAANSSPYPQLLRFEFEAGHGKGMPTWKRTERYTDIYSFIFWQLGMDIAE